MHFGDDWRVGETHDVHFSESAIGSFLDILVHAVCPGFGGCWDIRLFFSSCCFWSLNYLHTMSVNMLCGYRHML